MTGGAGNAEGGVSGQAGGGAAGTAGTAGESAPGASGAGAGNEGGACDAAAPRRKLSSTCEVVPVADPPGDSEDTIWANCSFESACQAVGCGGLWGPYDANMCRRPFCTSSADCASGERCVAPPLLGDFNCYSDYFSPGTARPDCSCEFEDSECAPRAFCLPVADYPSQDDCPVEGMSCDELAYGYPAPFDYLSPIISLADGTSDLVVALDACASKIQDAYAACRGGSGGEGGRPSQ